MADLSDEEQEGCDVLTKSEVLDCEKEDEPLVFVSVDTASNLVDMSADDEVTHATVEDVSNYAYRCTQIKRVATEARLRPELTRGCFSQFSDDKVLAMQLNTAEIEAQDNEADFNHTGFVFFFHVL